MPGRASGSTTYTQELNSLELVGNTLTGNTDGIRVDDTNDVVTIADNTVTGNADWGVYFEGTRPRRC